MNLKSAICLCPAIVVLAIGCGPAPNVDADRESSQDTTAQTEKDDVDPATAIPAGHLDFRGGGIE